jgi:hypothetical protein
MSHDVFISHTHADKLIADAMCAHLEQRGVRCWIAPRDVPPGESWPKAITQALDSCQIMVLIFSKSVLGSEQVEREMTMAANRKKIIMPVRTEDINPNGAFAYYLEDRHWLDAISPPVEQHLDQLADRLLTVLQRPMTEETIPYASERQSAVSTPPKLAQSRPADTAQPDAPAPPSRRSGNWAFVALVAVVVLLAAVVGYLAFRTGTSSTPGATGSAASSGSPSVQPGGFAPVGATGPSPVTGAPSAVNPEPAGAPDSAAVAVANKAAESKEASGHQKSSLGK